MNRVKLNKLTKKELIEEYIDLQDDNAWWERRWKAGNNYIKKLEQENKQLKRDKKIMQNYLELITNIGCNYDGYNDAENLKELIDELCKYALCGIKLDDKKIISSSCEKYYNILGEEILGDKENE